MPILTSIYDEVAKCNKCQWSGTVLDCEPDIDGDGGLGCPKCKSLIIVRAPEAAAALQSQAQPVVYEDDLIHRCRTHGDTMYQVRPGDWRCRECEA